MDKIVKTLLLILLFYGLAVDRLPGEVFQPSGFAAIHSAGCRGTTGGAGGRVCEVRSLADLKKYAELNEAAVLKVYGQIHGPPGERIRLASNKTLVGIGKDAAIFGPELHLIEVSNIIIRNLTIGDSYDESIYRDGKGPDYDGIQADACHHLWIDHCLFRRTNDGLVDLRKGCDCVTISWCVFTEHNKVLGVGWTERTDFRITMHHNWFHQTNQRNPAFDNGFCHLYNNWFHSITACGPHARGKARMLVENCVFSEVRNPLRCDPEAVLVRRGNEFVDCRGDRHGDENGALAVGYTYEVDPVDDLCERLKREAGPH